MRKYTEEDRGRTDVARNERAPDSGIGERRSREGDGGREKEGKEERERERELAAEFVDGLLHVCQHVYVSR